MFFRKRQPPTPEKLARSYLIISVLTLGLGTYLWQGDARVLNDAKASVTWPTTQGTIADSHIEESTQSSKSGSYQVYQCVVSYDYTVNGKKCTSNRLSYATNAAEPDRNRDVAERALHEFTAGNETAVHYNPSDPQQSVLVPGVNPHAVMLKSMVPFVIGAYTGVFAIVIWLLRAFLQPGPGFTFRLMAINLPCLFIMLGVMFNKPAIVQAMVPPSAVISE